MTGPVPLPPRLRRNRHGGDAGGADGVHDFDDAAMGDGFVGVDDDGGVFLFAQELLKAGGNVRDGNRRFVEKESAVVREREGDFVGDVAGGGAAGRQVHRQALLHGHGQRGDHEKHQEKKHGVDHGNDFQPGFFSGGGGEFHAEGAPAEARSADSVRVAFCSMCSVNFSIRARNQL